MMISGYLDPASGSAIIGAVAAGAAGAGVAAKTMMAKLRLRKRSADEPTLTEEPAVFDEETIVVDDPTQ